MTMNPKVRDARRLSDLEVGGVYLVRINNLPRPMMCEGVVNPEKNELGFMEADSKYTSDEERKIMSWRANRGKLSFESSLPGSFGVVVFNDGNVLVKYKSGSEEFKLKYPLLEKAGMPFT